MSELEDLTRKIIKFRDARDLKQFHNPKDVALSLMLEAGELAEHFQWKNEQEIKEYLASHKEEIGDELADVFYWVLLFSCDLGINIKEALEKKLKKTEEKYPVNKARGNHRKYTNL